MACSVQSLKCFWEPYRGIIRFCVILVVCHFFWKFTVIGDESSDMVTFFGCDISAPFIWMSTHLTTAVYAIINFFGGYVSIIANDILGFPNGNSVHIVWACSGIKQAYIFTCIILFSRGAWKHKIWFIPLGIVVCFLINVIRITILVAVIEHSFEAFNVLHEYILKYVFYGIIFLMWVLWEEKIAVKSSKQTLQSQKG